MRSVARRRVRVIAGALGEVFGVTGEGEAALHERTFLHRRGHHRRELAVRAPVAGAIQHLDDVGCIARIGMSGAHRGTQRYLHNSK
jgi:hypothetical protein